MVETVGGHLHIQERVFLGTTLQPVAANPRDACRRLLSDCKHYDLLTHLRALACSMLKYGELCDADSATPDLKTHGPDRNLLDGV